MSSETEKHNLQEENNVARDKVCTCRSQDWLGRVRRACGSWLINLSLDNKHFVKTIITRTLIFCACNGLV